MLWIIKNLRKTPPNFRSNENLCGVTCSTLDCLDDIHILRSSIQCTHVVSKHLKCPPLFLKLLVLRVSACGLHTAQWRMPNGFCFILSTFGVGDTLQIFLGMIGVRSQWRYLYDIFVGHGIGHIHDIWCGLGIDPPSHITPLALVNKYINKFHVLVLR